MAVHCISCGAPIPRAEIKIEQVLATCPACGAAFDFRDQVGHAKEAVPALPPGLNVEESAPPTPPPDAARGAPYRLAPRVEERERCLRITRRWSSYLVIAYVIALFLLGVIWLAVLIFALWMRPQPVVSTLAHPDYFMTAFASVPLLYLGLAKLLNKTVIEVTPGLIRVRHGPLPWPGNRRFPAGELVQLFVELQHPGRKHGEAFDYYSLVALLSQGRRVELLRSLEGSEQALYLERKIETWLGIKDHPVVGSLRAAPRSRVTAGSCPLQDDDTFLW